MGWIYVSLTPPTTRAPLAVLKRIIVKEVIIVKEAIIEKEVIS